MAIANNKDLTHVVRTTQQWQSSYDKYECIPEGVLCIEFTTSGQALAKIGNGRDIFSKLPYIGGADLTNYFTKEQTTECINDILKAKRYICIKGILNNKNQLPTNATCGDLYFVISDNQSSSNKYDEYVYSPNNTWEPLGSIPIDIDLSEYAKIVYVDEKIDEVNDRIDDIEQHGTHTHANKDILDLITAAFTAEEKDKLSTLYNYDDTELRELITQASHTHSNKDILDAISAAFTTEDRTKLDSLTPYDDSILREKITALERLAHEHSNKRILDQTTASFTTEYERKMRWIRIYTGCTGMEEGIAGLVPAAQAGEEDYVLSGAGEWVPQTGGGGTYTLPIATASTLGGIKVGNGLEIDANGVLSTTGGGGGGDSIAEGDGINITTDPQTGVKTIFVDTGNGLQINQDGEVEIDPSIIPEVIEYQAGDAISIEETTDPTSFRVVNQEYFFNTRGLTCGLNARIWTTVNDGDILAAMCIHNNGGNQVPLFVGLTEDSVKVSQNYDSNILGPNGSFDYLGKTWYFTADYALSGTDGQDTQGHIQTLPTTYTFSSTPSNFVPAAKDLIDLAVLLPDLTNPVISVKYKEGLKLNQYGELAVNVGDGLYIDHSQIDPTTFSVQNQEYFFDEVNVTATINGTYGPRSFVKLYADDCLFALCDMLSSGNHYNTPILVGLTENSVKVRVDGSYGTSSHGPNATFNYRGKTWYYTSGYGLMNSDVTDQTGTVQSLTTVYEISTEAEYVIVGKDLIDAAILLPDPDITTVNAKLGSGLQFDANGAIEVVGGGGSGGNGDYTAGDAIEFRPTQLSFNVDAIRWDISNIKSTSQTSGPWTQVRYIEFCDDTDTPYTISSASGIWEDNTSITYSTTGGSQTINDMIANTGKMCAIWKYPNHTMQLTFNLDTAVPCADIAKFRIKLGDDVPERDPKSWKVYFRDAVTQIWYIVQDITDAELSDTRNIWSNYYPFDITGATSINVKYGTGLSIDPITGELFVDGQLPEGTIIKKLTYTGNGSTASNTIQFEKKPLAILNIYGSSGTNYIASISAPIDAPYLQGNYGGVSTNGQSCSCAMSYNDSTNELTLTPSSGGSGDAGLLYNVNNRNYTVWYLVKGHAGSGTSATNEVSVVKTFSYVGTGTTINNIQFPETPDYILNISGPLGSVGDIITDPIDIQHPTTTSTYIFHWTQNGSGLTGRGLYSFNNSTNVLTLDGVDYGATLNYADNVYYVRYVVNETISSYEYTEGGGISITPDPQTGENIISVNVGSGLSIDPNTGELNVTGGGSGDTVAEGNGISITTDAQTGNKVIAVNAGTGLQFDQTTHALEVSSGVVTSIAPTQNTPGSITVTEGDGTATPVQVISQMGAATSSTAGTAGYVPAPSSGDDDAYLRGDGTWDDDVVTENDLLTFVFVPDDYTPPTP